MNSIMWCLSTVWGVLFAKPTAFFFISITVGEKGVNAHQRPIGEPECFTREDIFAGNCGNGYCWTKIK